MYITPPFTKFEIYVKNNNKYEENLYNKYDNQLVIVNNQNIIIRAKNALRFNSLNLGVIHSFQLIILLLFGMNYGYYLLISHSLVPVLLCLHRMKNNCLQYN